MIIEYKCNELPINIFSDLASEFPVYIYWSADKQVLLYSTSITELFDDVRIPKPLKASDEGISFLLQSGVVPPPKTGYKDIYILGIGDTAKITTVSGKIEITFKHEFPFMNINRLHADEIKPNADLILQMLALYSLKLAKPILQNHSTQVLNQEHQILNLENQQDILYPPASNKLHLVNLRSRAFLEYVLDILLEKLCVFVEQLEYLAEVL